MRYIFVGKQKEVSSDQSNPEDFCLIKAGDRGNAVYEYSFENAWLYNEGGNGKFTYNRYFMLRQEGFTKNAFNKINF